MRLPVILSINRVSGGKTRLNEPERFAIKVVSITPIPWQFYTSVFKHEACLQPVLFPYIEYHLIDLNQNTSSKSLSPYEWNIAGALIKHLWLETFCAQTIKVLGGLSYDSYPPDQFKVRLSSFYFELTERTLVQSETERNPPYVDSARHSISGPAQNH